MKKLILYIVCILGACSAIYGHGMTNRERRHMNDKLLELILSYENYSSFSEQFMKYAFADMFKEKNDGVYCDYIASGEYGKVIPVSEYAGYSVDSVRVRFVEVRNLKKKDYYDKEGRYRVSLEFDKCLDYEDENYTYFATDDETIGGDFHIVMECEFSPEHDKFFIVSIKGSANPDSTFPSGRFVIIERRNDRDTLLKVNRQQIRFNKFKEAYVAGEEPPVFDDEDILTSIKTVAYSSRYRKVNYSYRETRLRLRAGVTLSPISAYSVNSSMDFSLNKSSAYEASVDFGYALPGGGTSKVAFYAGLGVAYSSLDLGVGNIDYDYEMSDAHSALYTRKYHIDEATEGLRFIDIMIPLYVSYEQSVGRKLAFSLDAGVKLYLNADTKVNPYSVAGNVTIVSGEVQTTTDLPAKVAQYMIPASYMRNTYDVSAFAKAGLEVVLKPMNYLFVKIGYAYGLTESYNSDMNDWFKPSEGIYPFVYSGISGSDVAVRSFADCISYRRSALTFDFGYRMKF